MKRLLIIDTFNFLHRAYHAIPKNFKDSEGNPTNAIYGVTSMLVSALDEIKPNYIVCAVESKERLLRLDDFEDYKAHRKPMDEDLSVQIPGVFEILDAFGIEQIDVKGYEADDVIATLVENFKKIDSEDGKIDLEILILSNDRDLWQLVGANVFVMLPVKDGFVEWIGPDQVNTRMGFGVNRVADYKALKGDPSDNIPGVAGIGEKTAKDLIQEFGGLDDIYAAVESRPEKFSANVLKKLIDGKESAYKCKKLVLLQKDLAIGADLSKLEFSQFNKGRVKEVLFKYNFKSIIKRLGFEPAKQANEAINKDQLGLF